MSTDSAAPKTAKPAAAKPEAPKHPLSARREARRAKQEEQRAKRETQREDELQVVRKSLAEQSATVTAPPERIARVEKAKG